MDGFAPQFARKSRVQLTLQWSRPSRRATFKTARLATCFADLFVLRMQVVAITPLVSPLQTPLFALTMSN